MEKKACRYSILYTVPVPSKANVQNTVHETHIHTCQVERRVYSCGQTDVRNTLYFHHFTVHLDIYSLYYNQLMHIYFRLNYVDILKH